MTRTYGQACLIARALDVLGERWTLLIVRQLGLGPHRFSDLLAALEGIGTNLLSERLKQLQAYDVITKTGLAGSGSAQAYVLTERGGQLTPVLRALADWAAELPAAPKQFQRRTEWALLAMRAAAEQPGARFDTVTELHLDGEWFWVFGDGSHVQLRAGQAPVRAGLVLSCSRVTLQALATGQLSVTDAVARGELEVDGGVDTAAEFFRVFTLPAGPATAVTPGRHGTSRRPRRGPGVGDR
jgi:DNA-binding HxlR family transcriptional regulator